MNQTELLHYIYQNADMGLSATRQVAQKVEDGRTLAKLADQMQDYQSLRDEAAAMLRGKGEQAKDAGMLPKVASYINISIDTLLDNSPAHIAKLMMQGSTMGVADITEKLGGYNGGSLDAVKLGKRLLKLEEAALADWQLFLSDHTGGPRS